MPAKTPGCPKRAVLRQATITGSYSALGGARHQPEEPGRPAAAQAQKKGDKVSAIYSEAVAISVRSPAKTK